MYPENASMKLSNSYPAEPSTIWSMTGSGKEVFGASFVEVGEVDAHAPLPTVLLDHDDV